MTRRGAYSDRSDPDDWRHEYLMLALMGAGILLVGAVGAAMWVGGQLTGVAVPGNPLLAVAGLLAGTVTWPGVAADATVGVEVALVAVAVWVVWRWRTPLGHTRTEIDPLARHLATGRDLGPYTARGAADKAARLRSSGAGTTAADQGMFLGHTITYPVTQIRASWEDTMILISGPRIGKTSRFVIRQLIEAPGPALVTTVRRDVWDATAGPRERRGQVWNFDLQARIGEGVAPWWVDLLEGIQDLDDATRLMNVFADGTRDTHADSRNGYFESEGKMVVSAFLLAAAIKPGGGTFHDVHAWLAHPKHREASDILRAGDQDKVADFLDELRTMASAGQQDGVFGFARSLMSSLLIPRALRWVAPDRTPDGTIRDTRPRLSPTEFVTSTDTLYLHSKKGSRATPFIAALTQAVLDAGERRAHQLPAGRLDPPLVNILDEAANICPLRTLPDEYSTFGGYGMPTLTVLQSFEQGMQVWGRGGMKQLWNAATIRLYGGGSADPQFLDTLSKLLGMRDRTVTGSSSNGGLTRTTTSYNTRRDTLADIADLGALPPGRALLFPASARPTLLRTVPWWDTDYAHEIHASIAEHHNPTDPTDEPEPGPDVTPTTQPGLPALPWGEPA